MNRSKRPLDPPDETLIRLWHSRATRDSILDFLGISQSQLYECWRRLREQGRLPSVLRKPIKHPSAHTPAQRKLSKLERVRSKLSRKQDELLPGNAPKDQDVQRIPRKDPLLERLRQGK